MLEFYGEELSRMSVFIPILYIMCDLTILKREGLIGNIFSGVFWVYIEF